MDNSVELLHFIRQQWPPQQLTFDLLLRFPPCMRRLAPRALYSPSTSTTFHIIPVVGLTSSGYFCVGLRTTAGAAAGGGYDQQASA